MNRRHIVARLLLLLMVVASFAGSVSPGLSYTDQHRDVTNASPSARFPLGTDDLGRDRLARLLYATRISLLLAAAAALGAILLAVCIGGLAGYLGGGFDACVIRAIDLMLSLPWLFLLLAARALLPLNAPPVTSLLVTYGLLAVLGWASPARVVRAGVSSFRKADFVLQARAQGCTEPRLLLRYMLPNLKPVLLAQFWTSLPVFILAEANLGFLGLSAGEPFPTWGNLMKELQSPLLVRPEAFAPIAAVALCVLCFRMITPWGGSHA